ncbi:CHLOROPLAST IMPORT APPARATUS 2-like [Micractinium conductrix]|uniref:CHLOROPLAST IMPORT APPARATUS 2-like n=1 Tax=Micractinium conductrix TaxID=554055 RepID=A0A2P6VK18_9CHLO|nr:CHLOROPLAST IMPORT APPARATUS 2-like [Micractinium conductrix]|eukprot:PSC74418.1 CHLOROPLAST IMPORT APPARATUS 2-like [Micractinium conductrix]
MADCFIELPETLSFESSMSSAFDFLTVPQHHDDFGLSPSSSLDATDLFLPDISFEGSAEATSAFSSPGSEASSCLDDLGVDFALPLAGLEERPQEAPVPAPLPLGPSGLRLQLDFGSVMAAWGSMSGGAHPFQMRGVALALAASAIPSTADLHASLTAAAQPTGAPLPAADAEAEARRAREAAAAAARARDAARRAAQRKANDRKAGFPRKLSGDKRPRIKGRFVTKAEFEALLAADIAEDRAVPAGIGA